MGRDTSGEFTSGIIGNVARKKHNDRIGNVFKTTM